MLVFVDESEWPRPKDPTGYTVWAAAAIHPGVSKDFFREIFNLERKFWHKEEPYQFEIKGRLLLNKRAITSPKKREFVEELLSLCKTSRVLSFAVGMPGSRARELPGFEQADIYHVCNILLERVEQMMVEAYPNEWATVCFDSQDDASDTKRALAFGNFLYGSEAGRSLSHVVDTPFFVSSTATKGIQIADLFAYALAQWNLQRRELASYVDRIRELEWRSSRTDVEYPLRGFRFLRSASETNV